MVMIVCVPDRCKSGLCEVYATCKERLTVGPPTRKVSEEQKLRTQMQALQARLSNLEKPPPVPDTGKVITFDGDRKTVTDNEPLPVSPPPPSEKPKKGRKKGKKNG